MICLMHFCKGYGLLTINYNYDCIRELKMSDKTLAKSLLNNIPYNNYYYKIYLDK